MSTWPHPTRLLWSASGTGIARHDDVEVRLRRRPELAALPGMTEIDYIPGEVGEVRIGCDRKRDLTGHEQAAVMACLTRLAAAGHRFPQP